MHDEAGLHDDKDKLSYVLVWAPTQKLMEI